ncbi:hypothetical protein RJ639_014808 [Escallonia herrerae]|uniref:RNase H type-1 domain-containing protein n=1 Tax=Escallonia herrerae TaxID=1293975 RepID=A0AA88VJ47_9ASTE|nr:hypothetical protein RJ639_014808 [Escallonia herrerae]
MELQRDQEENSAESAAGEIFEEELEGRGDLEGSSKEWVILNTDGSCYDPAFKNVCSSCGWIIRDVYGKVRTMASRKLEVSNPLASEAYGLYYGLVEAKGLGVERLLVLVDSWSLEKLVRMEMIVPKDLRLVVSLFTEVMKDFLRVKIFVILRETNFPADYMAKRGARGYTKEVILQDPMTHLHDLGRDDMQGKDKFRINFAQERSEPQPQQQMPGRVGGR